DTAARAVWEPTLRLPSAAVWALSGLACAGDLSKLIIRMASPIRLISTDFDGTLFAEFENPPIPAELQEIIARLQADGAKWVINTGREMASLMETLARAGSSVEPDYLVLVEREIHLHRESQYVGLEEWNLRCGQEHAKLFSRVRADLPELINWINARFHA